MANDKKKLKQTVRFFNFISMLHKNREDIVALSYSGCRIAE